MVVLFKNEELEQIYESGEEEGKPRFGKEVVKAFIRKIDFMVAVEYSVQLAKIRSLHVEELTKEKKYKGMHSIRVNDKYRIIFKIIKQKSGRESIEISEIHELTDYH